MRGNRNVVYPHGAFCMIGGINEVNTPRQAEVIKYLAKTHNGKDFSSYPQSAVIHKNDATHTRWKDIVAWIKRARKLAIADGN